jgi:hypothetical protein
MICGRLADGPIADRRPDLPNSGHCEFVYLCARLYVTNGSSDHLFNIVIRIGARRDRRLCLFSNSVPMGCARRTECAVLAHAAFRRGLIAHSVQGAIQDGHLRPPWPPVSNPAARRRLPRRAPRPVPALAGTRALATVLAGASPKSRVVAGPVRLLLIRSCGLADGCLCRGVGAVRPRGVAVWSLDGRRPRMGLPWRCRSGPGTAAFLVRCRLRR